MTAAEILATANPATFPTDLLAGADSAICFFGAGFLGRNDVVHLWAAGVRNVMVVDTDESKLSEMHDAYEGLNWGFATCDAYAWAKSSQSPFVRERFTNDIVTVDPWTGDVAKALNSLPLWLSLTRRALVIGVTAEWFAAYQLPATLDGFNAWIGRQFWNGATVPAATRLIRRSDFRGGVWWAVFEVGA